MMRCTGRVLLLVGLILLGLGAVGVTGYCLGWYLPAQFEQVVSACRDPQGGSVSPSGRLLKVTVNRPTQETYLIDLQDGKWTQLTVGGRFLTEDLLLARWRVAGTWEFRVNDPTDGSSVVLNRLEHMPGAIRDDGTIDPEALAPFRAAQQVIISEADGVAIALAPDYKQHPDQNFVLGFQTPLNELEQLLRRSGITYQIAVHPCMTQSDRCFSHSGTLIARGGGSMLLIRIRKSSNRMAQIEDIFIHGAGLTTTTA